MAQTKLGAYKIASQKIGITLEEYLVKIQLEKWCYKCCDWKLKENYTIDNSRGDKLASKCNDCRRVKVRINTKGRVSPLKGKKITGNALENIRTAVIISNKKRTGEKKIYTPEGYANLVKLNKIPRPERRGLNHPNWKGGSAGNRQKERLTPEYREWRSNVFERDKHTCQHCGDNKGGNLEAHHIIGWAVCVELRYDITNGITLCKKCHRKVHFNPNSTRNIKKKKKGIPLAFDIENNLSKILQCENNTYLCTLNQTTSETTCIRPTD